LRAVRTENITVLLWY